MLGWLLASPAAAEDLAGQALCEAVWGRIGEEMSGIAAASGTVAAMDGDWCVVDAAAIDLEGQYLPDWHVDRLRFRGSALGWLMEGKAAPDRLEIMVEGLRLVVETGDARMDWLFAAQSRPNRIDAAMDLAWDAAARALRVEALRIDFPGENLVEFSAEVAGVDLSTGGSMQMSVTSFAVTKADLYIQTHGLFEWYVLMALGPVLLPQEGDMGAAADAIRTDLITTVVNLPPATFADASKDALLALIVELPNPSGDLTVALRSAAGVGPRRLMGYVMTGVPATVAAAAPIFEGVTIDIGWTHAQTP